MLVLTRKAQESISIGGYIKLTVIEIVGKQVKIGIDAPEDVLILREELETEFIKLKKVIAS